MSGAFLLLSGYVILDQMTCGGWYCQALGLLPAMPWILPLLLFGSRLPPALNSVALWPAVFANIALAYWLGTRLKWPYKR
jgi:hypothetical protein